jgi:nucleotide-binding universal stress UspA family protein
MDGFKRILCAVDFSEGSARALGYATELAAQHGGAVTVVRVLPETDPVLDDAAASERGRPELHRFVGRVLGMQPKHVELRTLQGDAVRRIVETAAVLPADVIVMGPHAEPRPERLPLGSVTQAVLTAAATPVAVVSAFAGRPGAVVSHVLCPIDFSPATPRLVAYAGDLALRSKARLTLQHIVDWSEERGAARLGTDAESDARGRLQDAARPLEAAGIACALQVDVGAPAREILFTARSGDIDLILMGAQSLSGWELLRLGSTTDDVVCEAPCPVLVIPRRWLLARGAPQAHAVTGA